MDEPPIPVRMHYVHTIVPQYFATTRDLSRERAVHVCDLCLAATVLNGGHSVCQQPHYSTCRPLTSSPYQNRVGEDGVINIPIRVNNGTSSPPQRPVTPSSSTPTVTPGSTTRILSRITDSRDQPGFIGEDHETVPRNMSPSTLTVSSRGVPVPQGQSISIPFSGSGRSISLPYSGGPNVTFNGHPMTALGGQLISSSGRPLDTSLLPISAEEERSLRLRWLVGGVSTHSTGLTAATPALTPEGTATSPAHNSNLRLSRRSESPSATSARSPDSPSEASISPSSEQMPLKPKLPSLFSSPATVPHSPLPHSPVPHSPVTRPLQVNIGPDAKARVDGPNNVVIHVNNKTKFNVSVGNSSHPPRQEMSANERRSLQGGSQSAHSSDYIVMATSPEVIRQHRNFGDSDPMSQSTTDISQVVYRRNNDQAPRKPQRPRSLDLELIRQQLSTVHQLSLLSGDTGTRISLKRDPDISVANVELELKRHSETAGNDAAVRLSPVNNNRKSREYRDSFIVKPQSPVLKPPSPIVHDRSGALNRALPAFHFPFGRPPPSEETEAIKERLQETFVRFGGRVSEAEMGEVAVAVGLSRYWRGALWRRTVLQKDQETVSCASFTDFWTELNLTAYDPAAKFIRLFGPVTETPSGREGLTAHDFIPLMQDIINRHPGLAFLQDARDFHMRYIHTVIARIFYTVNRSWSGVVTASELRRSQFLERLAQLDAEPDINRMTMFFSYEHFYVIYCRFWELDGDHDLIISREDLLQHNDYALNARIVDRLFGGAVSRGLSRGEHGRDSMTYAEFVWFLLAEEDKRAPTAVEYWFRCMDIDGDGVLSMYELEYFWEEQCTRLTNMGVEPFDFKDALCQVLDLVHPKDKTRVTLADLKRCKLAHNFFDMFLNVHKLLDNELKDPFSMPREDEEMSDWERYAGQEYLLLVADEPSPDGSSEIVE